MFLRSLIGVFLVLSIILAPAYFGCSKQVPKGPGGRTSLPTGKVDGGIPPVEETLKYPLYPGAQQIAANFYQTTDSISQVVDYYEKELKIKPEIKGDRQETRVFVTEGFTVVLVPMESGGTEIHFE